MRSCAGLLTVFLNDMPDPGIRFACWSFSTVPYFEQKKQSSRENIMLNVLAIQTSVCLLVARQRQFCRKCTRFMLVSYEKHTPIFNLLCAVAFYSVNLGVFDIILSRVNNNKKDGVNTANRRRSTLFCMLAEN